ncbi:hypothetical protein LTR56_023136 [Elasticomyces elasticus]|nr:hypothetical protein LTR56_023136 [Elasticomyces elasticus]KAK3626658.1 hypothetical protein LTR22_023085 [Elasticomyces elasticus]KAK4916331.1 hypothetical protein LTR49_015704 [Elasticomyces elasticus]KAK5764909.1 hypothetical protein LTS12_004936 [Elasticomyces elasticus]
MAAIKKTNRRVLRRSPRVQRTTLPDTTGQQSQGTPVQRAPLLPTTPSKPIVRRSPRNLRSVSNEPRSQTASVPRQNLHLQDTGVATNDDVSMAEPGSDDDFKGFSMVGEVNNNHHKGSLRIEFGGIAFDGKLYHESFQAKIMFKSEGGTKEHQVGCIDLHIIDKTYARPVSKKSRRGPKQWVAELLIGEEIEGELAELSMALRSLYDQNGAPRSEFDDYEETLNTTTIAYIQKLKLNEEWEKKGLGHVALQVLHQMLPIHCKNESDITLLLQADMLRTPGDNEGISFEKEEEMRKAKQEHLLDFYPKHGYEVVFRDADQLPCYLLLALMLKVKEEKDEDDGSVYYGSEDGGEESRGGDQMEID